MKKTEEESELEKKLILEEYDPITLIDKAEGEGLIIEEEADEGAEMVRSAYKKLPDEGHAIIRQPFSPFVA